MTETSSLFPYIRVFSCTEYWVQVVYSFPRFTPLLVPLESLIRGTAGMMEGSVGMEVGVGEVPARPRDVCGKAKEEPLPALPRGTHTPRPTPPVLPLIPLPTPTSTMEGMNLKPQITPLFLLSS